MKYLYALALLLLPYPCAAQQSSGGVSLPNPIVMVIVLGVLGLAPFLLMMLTSFIKFSVVLSILRNAIGTQQVPPNPVITGLAMILSIFVMAPVARQMYDAAGTIPNTRDMFSEASVKSLYEAAQRGKEPLRDFLSRHSHPQDRLLFMQLAARLDHSGGKKAQAAAIEPAAVAPAAIVQTAGLQIPPAPAAPPPAASVPAVPPPATPLGGKNDFEVLIPSFATSQLKEAFQIGFLIFVPFLIVDMVVANVLLAMGMHMLSPVVISLPFKLLLFVLVDGWFLIVRGLVMSYA